MEVDSNFSSLLRNLKVKDPWIPPKSWESIPSESGSDPFLDPAQIPQDSTKDIASISESNLVRLCVNALQGLKSAILQIDQLSAAFCSIPADRTMHQVPSLWCRSLSTSALGVMLKSISRSGLVFHFLREFVNHYLCLNVSKENGDENEMKMRPPYSLVNQAFGVAIGKVLEGYVSSLNTLLASVKLRRALKHGDGEGILTSVVSSEITLLEVYLHTDDLRSRIESLGNICFPNVVEFASLRGSLNGGSAFEFHEFPRGADLLTYLYVLLRDADPGHHALLKFLFIQSCEPYCAFIKSWIYHARVDDPYGEFFVVHLHTPRDLNDIAGSNDALSLASIKERDCTPVPCFLKDVCRPVIRAGQQLGVLVKLLNVCNFAVIEEYESCNLENLEDILPFWAGIPNNSSSLLNQLTFSRKGIQVLLRKREFIYKAVVEKLQNFFANLDVRYQRMHRTVIPFGSLVGRRITANSPFSLISDGELISASITDEQGANHVAAGYGDTDANTSYDSLFDASSPSSESSSSCSYEDEVERGPQSELPDISDQSSDFLLCKLLTSNAGEGTAQNAEIEKPFIDKAETMDTVIPLVQQAHGNGKKFFENDTFLQTFVTLQPDVTTSCKLPETHDNRNLSGKCWPLGALPSNPFYFDMKHKVPKPQQITEFCQQKADGRRETLVEEETDSGEMFVRFSSEFDATVKTQVINKTQSWNTCDRYDLSVNPSLTKTDWLRTVRNVRDRGPISNDGPCFPYFDFSSVLDPCAGYSESMVACQGHESQGKAPTILSCSPPSIGLNENSGKMKGQLVFSSSCSSGEANDLLGVNPPSASGGSGWEGLLNYSCEGTSICGEDEWCELVGSFETPLDVVIDKCILQEILIQYKYVSNFTIKLLQEGFDLHGHLLALRRYHFMEQADWADSFIMFLRNQNWLAIEPEQKITKTQGLLDLALQRSSCSNDPYKERLFVYAAGQSMTSEPTSATGLHAFDFLMLGYRVDWPVNIIITQDALRTYAEIFSYLIQVRLAVISLTDVWYWLKAGIDSTKHSQSMDSHKVNFTSLMKMRLQINHFVSTLQEYIHSHLSDVSWCQFQHSLRHQVKDMLDLESVHKSYLADALPTCFLSVETKPIATIIKSILQCALDFRLCFSGSGLANVRSDGTFPSDIPSQIDSSQVFAIKTTFERNIKDLYGLYLKSPKHGEFSLFRFWSLLNYNDYYSLAIAKEMDGLYH